MQLYEWEGQGVLSAITHEFCGLHSHLIHLLFYWHWLGIEEIHVQIRLPVRILTKEGNSPWLPGTRSGIPPCPSAALAALLLAALGWQQVSGGTCRLAVITMLGKFLLQKVSEESSSWITALSLLGPLGPLSQSMISVTLSKKSCLSSSRTHLHTIRDPLHEYINTCRHTRDFTPGVTCLHSKAGFLKNTCF